MSFGEREGPVGKLHNLVVAIHRSDLLTTLLRSIQRLEFDTSSDPRLRIQKDRKTALIYGRLQI
jgi:hypothetical protein